VAVLRGAFLQRAGGRLGFLKDVVLNLSGAEVTREGDTDPHTLSEVSVGQRVLVFGDLDSQADPAVMTATQVRLLPTTLRGVVVILDIRREPSAEDLMLLEWLKSLGLAVVLALTKADKLSRNQSAGRLAKLRPILSPFDPRPVLFSALSGLGREDLWARMQALVDPPEPPAEAD
jgi:hypothetical protein